MDFLFKCHGTAYLPPPPPEYSVTPSSTVKTAPHFGHLILVSLDTPAQPKEKKAKSTKAKNKLTIFIQFFILGIPFLQITPTIHNIIIEIGLFNLTSKVRSGLRSFKLRNDCAKLSLERHNRKEQEWGKGMR